MEGLSGIPDPIKAAGVAAVALFTYLSKGATIIDSIADFFTSEPDYTPFKAVAVDSRVFDPQKALDPFDENFDWKALEESPIMDNNVDMIQESKEKDEYRLENREKL